MTSRFQFRRLLSCLSVCLTADVFSCAAVSAQSAATAESNPNIVIIFMDDMGYADIGPFGGDKTLTPNLNRMAEEGRRFTDFYVSQAVCSASRTSLLTGCYNVRVGIQGALGPASKEGIHSDEVTLGELCQQKDYATACFGKWHLGSHQQFLPLKNGFDEYFGLPYSNDMWPFHPEVMHLPMEERLKRWPHLPLIDGNTIVNAQVTAADQRLLTTQYTERAVSFIDRNAERPFFLYLAHSMVHVPLFVSDKFNGKSGKGLFSDVIMEVDWSVGQVLEALKQNNVDQNTLVIFTSDNGPWLSYGDHAGSAHPFREGKGTMFDGGCRVPFLARWPGRIPANSSCSEPAMTIDLLPTVAKLIGAELPKHPIDGKDIWPLLAGEEGAKSPQEAYYFYWGHNLHAVRSGQWKLHLPHEYRTLSGRPGGTGGIPTKYDAGKIEFSLFDLKSDPGESSNVVEQHPEVVARLQALANSIQTELGEGQKRGTGQRKAGRLIDGKSN
ncbi:MAG: sulfatase [Planctomycetaceae bacterium]